ncbi:DUF1697 domain-containing protein [Arthrobacter globiformis]|uniref:DUF1697 domain-containing protein n=1 Tax=Arthrobacter globiformis TaxID=1665 RepID=UPI002792228C|nr:DUF1697 domain-containing protein [Arthrobacter globiformis]MDQ0619371.1 uncharacterized protein (DUF1697 family) [Arthrobacter globiformis]
MTSYAVFLRGINVGGITIKMADLKDALKAGPFTGVKTLLASGNVVLVSELEPAAVKKEFETTLRKAFGYDAWVVVLTSDRVSELVAACRYPADDKSTHTYLTLASDTAALDELFAAAEALDGAVEQDRLGPEAMAWLAPAGGTLESPFSKLSAKPKYKASTTTRNLRTMIKVRDAAAALETAAG